MRPGGPTARQVRSDTHREPVGGRIGEVHRRGNDTLGSGRMPGDRLAEEGEVAPRPPKYATAVVLAATATSRTNNALTIRGFGAPVPMRSRRVPYL